MHQAEHVRVNESEESFSSNRSAELLLVVNTIDQIAGLSAMRL